MHPNAKKTIPMTRKQIRAELARIDRKAGRLEKLEPCGLSFDELMKDLLSKY